MMRPKYTRQIISGTFITLVLALSLTVRAGAQAGGPAVRIDGVENEAFPQVSAYVTVADENGLPLAGLNETNFQVIEDGVAVQPASVVVNGDTTQPLGLVVAIDVSATDEALAAVKAAASSFLLTVSPRDRAALVAFADDTELVQNFTNNTQVLRDAVNGLAPAGETTALNQALLDALAAAQTLPSGREAVVVVTNATDNETGPTAEQVAQSARAAGIPIYLIGYGSEIEAEALRSFSQQVGGQAFILSTPDDLSLTLQTIGVLLRQRYKITYQSGLKADNAKHTLTIRVTHLEQQAEAETGFVALPGQVAVTLPDLAAGQMVGGVVTLIPQVSGPAPVASVEYLLDGNSLAERTSPPYSFDWDADAAGAGSHTLAVEVVDAAGNRGRTEIGLEVAGAPAILLSQVGESAESGNEVTVEAQVDAPAGVSQIEFLLDGKVVGSVAAPPYRLSFNSADHRPGEHVVVARARDTFGRSVEAALPIQLSPAPTRSVSRLPGVLGIFVSLVLAVVALGRIWAFGRRVRRRTLGLEIENKGNLPSRFELRADDPAGALRFEFALNGTPLPRRQGAPVANGPSARATEPSTAVAATGPARSPALSTSRIGHIDGQLNQSTNGLIDLLSSIAYMLPYTMRGPLQRIIFNLRQGQFAASQVRNLPGRAGAILPSGAKSQALPAPATGGSSASPSLEVARRGAEDWAQTPSIHPGETLRIELQIVPSNAGQTQTYPFRVISRSLEQEDAPEVITHGTIRIVAPSWVERFAPTALFIGVTVTAALVIASLLVGTGLVAL